MRKFFSFNDQQPGQAHVAFLSTFFSVFFLWSTLFCFSYIHSASSWYSRAIIRTIEKKHYAVTHACAVLANSLARIVFPSIKSRGGICLLCLILATALPSSLLRLSSQTCTAPFFFTLKSGPVKTGPTSLVAQALFLSYVWWKRRKKGRKEGREKESRRRKKKKNKIVIFVFNFLDHKEK